MKKLPNFDYEVNLWDRGIEIIGGADEVGRGSFAGPIVSAVCAFSSDVVIPTSLVINDSKKLTQKMREMAYIWIVENAYIYGIGSVSAYKINKIGLQKSLHKSYRLAVKNAEKLYNRKINHLLVDAIKIPRISGIPTKNQTAIIKGDSISFSIASASILAKVHRDEKMRSLAKRSKFKKYFWEKNKGYGTLMHRNAIITHGISPQHRIQFVETFMRKSKQ